MAINFPKGRGFFIPKVPETVQDAAVADYLNTLRTQLDELHNRAYDNANTIRNALSTGTSGTFVDSLGATVTVADGIITGLA